MRVAPLRGGWHVPAAGGVPRGRKLLPFYDPAAKEGPEPVGVRLLALGQETLEGIAREHGKTVSAGRHEPTVGGDG